MTIYKFAMIAGNDVFSILSIDSEDPSPVVPRLLAGLKSDPIVIEITDINEEVNVGWTWDGSQFLKPEEDYE